MVRADDTGTQSLVFDPKTGTHTWREIPFQAPAMNSDAFEVKLKLAPDGSAAGSVAIIGKGRTGSVLRRTARNAETTAQFMQRMAGVLMPGSSTSEPKVLEAKSLTSEAVIEAQVESKSFARAEGDSWRVRMPSEWNPRYSYGLATRRHPLVLGTPTQYSSRTVLSLPEGFAARKLPQEGTVEAPCLSYSRKVALAPDGQSLEVRQQVQLKCERIPAADYPQYRGFSDAIGKIQDDELVLGPGPVYPERSRGAKVSVPQKKAK